MLRNILHIARFDLKFMLRDRETILWLFIMPVLFMFLIGKMMGGPATGPAQLAVWDRDGGPVASALVSNLAALDYRIVPVQADSTLREYSRQLEIPVGFTRSVVNGAAQKVVFRQKSSGSSSGNFDELKVRRAVFRTIGDLVTVAARGDSVGEASLTAVRSQLPAIALESQTLGIRHEIPTGFQQSVPGIMVMFTLLVLLTTGGVLLVVEREEGLLRRLAFAPVSRGEIVSAKILARFFLGLIQAGVAMLIGTFVLRINWGGNVPAIICLLFIYGLALAAVSVVVGNLSRSRGQAVGLGVLSANVLGALGGCWWPIEVVSPFMQKLAWFLPTGWAMYGLHRLMSFGDGIESILVPIILLAGLAVVGFVLARRTFRYQ